jgi:hypothetical protein
MSEVRTLLRAVGHAMCVVWAGDGGDGNCYHDLCLHLWHIDSVPDSSTAAHVHRARRATELMARKPLHPLSIFPPRDWHTHRCPSGFAACPLKGGWVCPERECRRDTLRMCEACWAHRDKAAR